MVMLKKEGSSFLIRSKNKQSFNHFAIYLKKIFIRILCTYISVYIYRGVPVYHEFFGVSSCLSDMIFYIIVISMNGLSSSCVSIRGRFSETVVGGLSPSYGGEFRQFHVVGISWRRLMQLF